MGCGSSSTQVKEFKPGSRKHSVTVRNTENHNNQTAHTAIREKSDISNKSNKSISTRSSRVSESEREKSGKLSRSSSAKSDTKVKEIENTKSGKSSRSSSAVSDRNDKSFDGRKSGNSSRFSSAKSDRKDKETENLKSNAHAYYALLNEADNLNETSKSQGSHIANATHSDKIVKVGEADENDLFGEASVTDGDNTHVIASAPFGKDENVESEKHEIKNEVVNNNVVQYEDGSLAGAKSEKAQEEEYDEFAGFEFSPITVPEINKDKEFPVYTIDDIVNNNVEKGKNNWFLYGRNVYTLDLFTPIVFSRVQEYLNMTDQDTYSYTADEILRGTTEYGSYPVYVARNNGVRRKEMDKILPASQIGTLQNISREEYLSRLKQSVDNIKSDLEAEEQLTEYLADYLEQLSRWISSYPNVELEQPVDRTNVDPNQCEFPLPDKIRADCSVIRQWARDWVQFDMTVDEEGAWTVIPLLNVDWGDVHQTFVDMCAKREDVELPAMNMEIAGEAAWDVIQIDIVKNDVTTKQQEEAWKARENRKDLNDPERMRRRRKKIADSFLKRHDTRLKMEDMVEYGEWADRLEKHWKEFQELCETFVPRQHVSDPTGLEPKKLAEDQDHVEQETNDTSIQLPDNIPPQDTMSIRSDHGLN